MKKSLKIIAAGLALIPCALALTACGGDKPLVNVSGKYQTTSSYAQLESYIEDQHINTELTSYKLRLTMDMTTNMYGMTMSAKTKSTMLATNNGNDIEAKLSVSASGEAMGTSQSEQFDLYLKDNTVYQKLNGQWNSMPLLNNAMFDEMLDCDTSFEDIFSDIEDIDLAGLTVTTDVSETTTKYKVTLDGKLLADFMNDVSEEVALDSAFEFDKSYIYFVFENNNFVGMSMDFGASYDNNMTGENKIAISYNIKIEYASVADGTTVDFPADLPSA